MPKLASRIIFVLMPTSCAASLLCEVASIALPCKVRVKNHASTATMTSVTPNTHRLCGSIVAPSTSSGWSPEKAGSACVPLPSFTCTSPRMNSEAPMVMMISVTTSAFFAGSMASFSTSRPPSAAAATAMAMASGSGMPCELINAAAMPPSMMNSPWAKLITPLAL